MNGDGAFLQSSGLSDGACLSVEVRGELAIGTLVFGRSVRILTLMQSCASAAKLRAAGPFSPSAFGATSATGSRHLGSSTGSPRCGCQQRASSR